jgi:predicted Zn-dependent peptidase
MMMPRNKFFFFNSVLYSLLLFLPLPLFSYELSNRIETYTLKNGLRLLMMERHLSPTVSIYIRHRAGAVDESDGKTGAAHLLEHMMFKGTKSIGSKSFQSENKFLMKIKALGEKLDQERMNGVGSNPAVLERLAGEMNELQTAHKKLFYSNEIDRLYTEQGAVHLNASTSQDLTTYQVSLPANRLELWARIESDRMANPVFREYFTERDVVLEERRQRSDADPDGQLLERYLATAFIAHPYRRPIVGWPSDIRFLDMAYLRAFFLQTHAPNNTVIAIVGDIRPSECIALVKRYFGGLPYRKKIMVPITEEPQQSGERRIEVLFAADPEMIMGFHKPAPPAFADYVFDLVESLLTSGRTSRLFKSLVEEKRIAKSIHAYNGLPGARYPNQFAIFASPRYPHTCLELEQAIDEEFARLKHEPVPGEELDKVKNQIKADFIRGLNSNAGLASMLSYYEALFGNYSYLTDYVKYIDRITPADIQQAAERYLNKENKTVALLIKKP